ncbi:MAG: hypothetical protein RL189_3208 [Pseudomonadota bacterium]
MKKSTRSYFSRDIHKLGCLLIPLLTFMGIQSCSTVEEGTGRCKAFKDPKYVASSQDTDGKKWQLLVSPEVVDLKCDKLGAPGVIYFTATVLDGQGFAKPALAITDQFIGSSQSSDGGGFKRVDGETDSATDSCGTARFRYDWTCPDAKKSTGGFFYATSGPLASKAIKVTLEHIVQQDQIIR